MWALQNKGVQQVERRWAAALSPVCAALCWQTSLTAALTQWTDCRLSRCVCVWLTGVSWGRWGLSSCGPSFRSPWGGCSLSSLCCNAPCRPSPCPRNTSYHRQSEPEHTHTHSVTPGLRVRPQEIIRASNTSFKGGSNFSLFTSSCGEVIWTRTDFWLIFDKLNNKNFSINELLILKMTVSF